jgi:hypothetical protein
MYSWKFTVIFHLLLTIFLINGVTSATSNGSSESRKSRANDGDLMATEISSSFVATTPSIVAKSAR